jgi:uncharacterized protein (TIGR02453 family)
MRGLNPQCAKTCRKNRRPQWSGAFTSTICGRLCQAYGAVLMGVWFETCVAIGGACHARCCGKVGRPKSSVLYTEGIAFFDELREHNQREWFQANRARYENELRDPFLDLIAGLQAPLKRISPGFIVDPRPSGGSMMRIYRDIRFAREKRPYNTALAAHFWYAKGKEGATPAYYLRIEPGSSMIGGGIWRPDAAALAKIRQAIVSEPAKWRRATNGAAFGSACGMVGESLKKAPRGFDPEHPLIEDLKRKDFAIKSALSDQQVTSPEVLDEIVGAMRATVPFVEFLVRAIETL